MSWYYAENNERRGPIEDAAFQTLVAGGTIKPETLVWRDGFPDWVPYQQATRSASAAVTTTGGTLADSEATTSVAAVCSQCARLYSADDMVSYEGQYICADCKPLFFQKIKEGAVVTGQREYAGFWIRFGAKFIDGIIINVAQKLIGMILTLALKDEGAVVWVLMVLGLVLNACYVIYFTGKYGATPGKMACKIEVIRDDGSPMTFGRATGRYFAEILSGLSICIGYLMAAFDEEKRALHDRICDTRVIRKR